MNLDNEIYKAKQKMNWLIDGVGVHCIPLSLWDKLSVERIVELYNVEMEYFKLKK
jgi:hypothetical protein